MERTGPSSRTPLRRAVPSTAPTATKQLAKRGQVSSDLRVAAAAAVSAAIAGTRVVANAVCPSPVAASSHAATLSLAEAIGAGASPTKRLKRDGQDVLEVDAEMAGAGVVTPISPLSPPAAQPTPPLPNAAAPGTPLFTEALGAERAEVEMPRSEACVSHTFLDVKTEGTGTESEGDGVKLGVGGSEEGWDPSSEISALDAEEKQVLEQATPEIRALLTGLSQIAKLESRR